MSCVAGGRFKKEVVIDGQSYLLLIRDEGGPPEMQVSTMRAMGGEGKRVGGGVLVLRGASQLGFTHIERLRKQNCFDVDTQTM